jgi:hypothetical protein
MAGAPTTSKKLLLSGSYQQLVHLITHNLIFLYRSYDFRWMQPWPRSGQQLAGIGLGDARLNKRSVRLLDRLADKPTASIPHACNGWAETQAAYRFLAQQEIGWEDILAPHFNCTQQHMQGRPVVLCIQDTTELDFHGQQTAGLGTLSFGAQRAMYLHPT